jgi:hypothetical protein
VSDVYGVAYEHTAAERRPLAGLQLLVSGYRPGNDFVTLNVVTDSAGRYDVAGLRREYLLVSVKPQDAYFSPCSIRMWLWGDGPQNVHVVPRESLLANGLPQSMPLGSLYPGVFVFVMSGTITERTAAGAQPVREALVEHLYGDGHSGDPTGFILTTADGRYTLCGYWDDYGQSLRVSKKGYLTAIQSIGPRWDIDFELVRE